MTADTVREDIGYMRYQLSREDTYLGKTDKVKIVYINGMMKGKAVIIRRDFAEDLIKRGFAREEK